MKVKSTIMLKCIKIIKYKNNGSFRLLIQQTSSANDLKTNSLQYVIMSETKNKQINS